MFSVKHDFEPDIIEEIQETGLCGQGAVSFEKRGEFTRVLLEYNADSCRQDDLCVSLRLGFKPDFWWIPHLTPEDGYIAAQHIFRTPALIARGGGKTLILIPDTELAAVSQVPWYLDMDVRKNTFYIGMSLNQVAEHVLYRKCPGAVFDGKVSLAFYVMALREEPENPFRPVLEYFWSNYGRSDSEKHLGYMGDLTRYVKNTYNWAFDAWKDVVWQEFELGGKTVGAPVFIVNVTQSPNYPGPVNERETRSVWNQAWFCSLRSASGLYRYARRQGDGELMEYALKTKELALAFPQQNGLFDSVIATEMETVFIDGRECNRSLGWDTKYFGNSNRNPFSGDLKNSPGHILDMAFLCYYMLIWYEELERDSRLLDYVTSFADRLLELQKEDGFYPAWVDSDGASLGVLDKSPESAMGAATLIKLYSVTKNEAYLDSAEKALKAVMTHIVPEGRWEDFETYWSCSRVFSDRVGEKISRNDMYKQCNFSMYFTARALIEAYKATGKREYLLSGRRVLDELLMTQSSYQPSNILIPVIGGFGVMNCDAELNDSRQSLFALLIMEYGKLLDCDEYIQRGMAALKAGFSMMYCPENPDTKEQWEKRWDFFGSADYGFMMENYGHSGTVGDGGIGIGEFTIYDWGNGAASEAFEAALDRGFIEYSCPVSP